MTLQPPAGARFVVDVRELSFQNVIDQILKPNNVNVGGFPVEIFASLTEEEEAEYLCNIWSVSRSLHGDVISGIAIFEGCLTTCFSFLILNEPRQCCNKHLFCETCIFAWSMTYGENSQKCPVCRSEQRKYEPNSDIRRLLWDKQVACPEDKCDHKVLVYNYTHCFTRSRDVTCYCRSCSHA